MAILGRVLAPSLLAVLLAPACAPTPPAALSAESRGSVRFASTTFPTGAMLSHAVGLGLLYLAAAALSVRLGRKAHFKEIYGATGLLLLLGALLSGVLGDSARWPVWLVLLLVAAGLAILASLRLGRSLYLALAVAAAYAGLLRPLFGSLGLTVTGLPFLLAALVGGAALWVIFAAHRRMRPR